jgi:AraC-like DNA-binding protein
MKDITYNLMLEDSLDMPVVFRSLSTDYDQETIRWGENYTDFHIIHLIIGGSGILRVGGKEYKLCAGCAFFVKKGVAFDYINTGNLKGAFLSTVGSVPEQFSLSCTDGHLFYSSVDLNKYVDLIAEIKREYYAAGKKAKLSTLAYGLLSEFFSEKEKHPTGTNEQVLSYIKRNFTEKLTLDRISSAVGISVSKLCHDFKRAEGYSVFTMIKNLRLDYARELLTEITDCTVGEVAASCGFDDLSYFCSAYKKRFGKSPSGDRVRF